MRIYEARVVPDRARVGQYRQEEPEEMTGYSGIRSLTGWKRLLREEGYTPRERPDLVPSTRPYRVDDQMSRWRIFEIDPESGWTLSVLVTNGPVYPNEENS